MGVGWLDGNPVEGSTVVIIAASEPGHQHDVMGWTVLPVQVKREVSFQRAPNSQNILSGHARVGPIRADASGTVTFTAALDLELAKDNSRRFQKHRTKPKVSNCSGKVPMSSPWYPHLKPQRPIPHKRSRFT